jgi:hypothetical protein
VDGRLMAHKRELFAVLFIVALIVSAGVNLYYANQTRVLTGQNATLATRLEMDNFLSEGQVAAEAELERIGNSLVYASQQLSFVGLQGDQARAVISALAANSSFIIDAATQDLNSTLILVEPSSYSDVEGENVGTQFWLNTNPNSSITPVLTSVISLAEGFLGVVMAAPVFQNGAMIGAVSVIFNPATLLNATVGSLLTGKSYGCTIMQLDGLTLYDTDAAQIGKNLFTDAAFAGYTELLTLGHQVAEKSSGYGTYSYIVTLDSAQVVEKECSWTTISAYGTEWRFSLIDSIDT